MIKLKKAIIAKIILLFVALPVNGQIPFYQNILNGGVTGAGVNFGASQGTLSFDVFIEPGSTVLKAFLFVGADGTPADLEIELNGIQYSFTSNTIVTSDFLSFYSSPPTSTINCIDITNDINSSISNYNLTIPSQDYVSQEAYYQFYLLIVYENPTLPETAVAIVLNNLDVDAVIDYNLSSMLPINNSYDVGLSILGKHFCDTIQDGSFVFVNGNNIGLVGGSDLSSPSFCTGVSGHFYYNNNILYGLDDDTPDNLISGTDAIANIQTYVSDNDMQLDLNFIYQNPSSVNGSRSNPIMAVFLSYVSPCDTFSVSTPNDTTLCHGEQLPLNVTGGQSYEWLPATGLSCADCPNPIFTADSSMFYTVRIWNNDSCSVVRPLKINVRPKLEWGTITTTPSECGANTGIVTLNSLPNNVIVDSWTEVGGITQTSNVFQNLSAGNHTFFFTDTNGCQSADTTIFVGSVNSINAGFSVSPQSGAVPLTVIINNTSQNATNYEWFLDGVSQGNSFTSTAFGISGNYEIMLVAWNNNSLCSDTAWQTVIVYDSLIVTVPNVFTPNHDNINEFLTLTANQDVNYELIILNRWGNEIFVDNGSVIAGTTKNIWNGNTTNSTPTTDGVYFVKLKIIPIVGEVVEIEDFVTVAR